MNDRWAAPRRIDAIEPGWFALRLVRKGPEVAAAIFHDPVHDVWGAKIGATYYAAHADPWQAAEVSRIWEGGRRLTLAEYRTLAANPPACPDLPINLGQAKVVF